MGAERVARTEWIAACFLFFGFQRASDACDDLEGRTAMAMGAAQASVGTVAALEELAPDDSARPSAAKGLLHADDARAFFTDRGLCGIIADDEHVATRSPESFALVS